MRENLRLRPSPIAGQWYAAEPTALARSVDAYIAEAKLPQLQGEILGVIAPHAGHRYSGPVAGYAFAALRGMTPELVAVLSPFHNYHSAPLLTPDYEAYRTPLGNVTIDSSALQDFDRELRSTLDIGLTQLSSDPEHSLEIELPFLQRVLTAPWKLLPVMVRAVDPRISEAVGRAVARVLQGRNALVIASTDLSHYYPQSTALVLDGRMLSKIEAFDPLGAFEVEGREEGFACGLGALTAVMWACKELGATDIAILRHATSGDVTGDYDAVVGYGAAAILRRKR